MMYKVMKYEKCNVSTPMDDRWVSFTCIVAFNFIDFIWKTILKYSFYLTETLNIISANLLSSVINKPNFWNRTSDPFISLLLFLWSHNDNLMWESQISNRIKNIQYLFLVCDISSYYRYLSVFWLKYWSCFHRADSFNLFWVLTIETIGWSRNVGYDFWTLIC